MHLRISLPCVSKLWLWSKHGHRNLKHWELPVISQFLSIFYIQSASSLDFLSDLAFVAWRESRFLILSSNLCPGLLIGLLQAVSASAELFCNQMPLGHTTSFSLTTGAGPPSHFLNVTFRSNPCRTPYPLSRPSSPVPSQHASIDKLVHARMSSLLSIVHSQSFLLLGDCLPHWAHHSLLPPVGLGYPPRTLPYSPKCVSLSYPSNKTQLDMWPEAFDRTRDSRPVDCASHVYPPTVTQARVEGEGCCFPLAELVSSCSCAVTELWVTFTLFICLRKGITMEPQLVWNLPRMLEPLPPSTGFPILV